LPGPDIADPDGLHADDLALLWQAATEAGRLARGWWGRSPRQWDKGDGQGPVSEADLAVDALLHARLTGARPGYGWLSEESPDDPARHTARRSFVVDPIDGTRSFLARERVWAISVAVVECGLSVAGVVHLPLLGRTYAAARGQGATLNGAPIRVGLRADPDGAEVLTNAASLDPALWPGGVPPVIRAFRPSLAYRLCLVAEGRYDAMLTLRDAWEWDIAAGALIAAEAGATVTDRTGASPRFNAAHPATAGLVVAGAALHDRLIAGLTGDAPTPQPVPDRGPA
jgi:myo-inositol-1(or 4)-monophosphatase